MAKLYQGCTQFLSGHGLEDPARDFRELADYCEAHQISPDRYGSGDVVNSFEDEVAALLGKEAAVFMPSGVMAQLIALRIWADRAGSRHFALHPTSHVEVNEEKAYAHLHNLEATLIGDAARALRPSDLDSVPKSVATLLLELPQRRNGGALPSWLELAEIQHRCRSQGTRVHLDGARIWECQPHYQRTFAEICEGFDSVYVSFYKGIGAMTGAMLLGPQDFIQEARTWQRRHGGNLYHLLPYVVSARLGFEKRLGRFEAYYRRALSLAQVLAQVPGVRVEPQVPQSSMMHIVLPGEPERLAAARDEVALSDGFWLGGIFTPARVPGHSVLELSVGDATMLLSDEDVVRGIEKLFGS